MPHPPMLALLLGLCLLGCDTGEVTPPVDDFPFDPDTTDFDAITSLSYGDYVQPLLAYRNVFSATATEERGALSDYEWADLFGPEAANPEGFSAGETIIPFDTSKSDLIRFVRRLAEDVEIPYPNLRTLQDDEVRYLARWIEDGARNDAGMVPYHDAEHLLYAAMQGENYLSIIDAERRQVIRNVYFGDHGLQCAPNGPHYMVFEPDRSAVYVSLVNCNTVAKISGSLTMDPSDPAYLLGTTSAFTTPGMMALDHDAGRLYVGRSTASQPGTTPTIGVFDPASLSLIEEFPIPDPGTSFPHALALSSDGRFLLTAPLTGDYALSMDAATGEILSRVAVGGQAELVHFSILAGDDTATLTANPAGAEPDKVLFFSLSGGGELTLDGFVPTGGERAWHAHLDSDGRTVMVPNRASDSVSRIDVAAGTAMVIGNDAGEANWPLAMPHSPGPSHAGAFFVSNSNLNGEWTPPYPFLGDDGEPLPTAATGNVVALDPQTGAVLKVIPLGRYPSGLEHWHAGGHHGGHRGGHNGHGH